MSDIGIFLSAWKSYNKRGARENPGQGEDRSSRGNCSSQKSPIFWDELIRLIVFCGSSCDPCKYLIFLQQMADMDDAMAQAVDIGENDVRFSPFRLLSRSF